MTGSPAALAVPYPATPLRRRIPITPIGVLSFLCGCFALHKVYLVGELYLAEIVMLPVAIIALAAGGAKPFREPLFWKFVAAWLLTMLGYVISDLIRDTLPDQYTRGWARNAFMGLDFVALVLLVANDRRNLWWFVLGLGAGGVLYLRLVLHLPISMWKFGYGVPMMLGAACLAAWLPMRLVAVGLAAVGTYSFFADFRIHGAICLVVAAILFARGDTAKKSLSAGSLLRLGALLGVGMLGIWLLLSATQHGNESRRDASDFGRLVGLKVGIQAIEASPIIGWGSWSSHGELVEISRQVVKEVQKSMDYDYYARGREIFVVHAQVLQAWVEGGVLGAAFFLFFGYQLYRWLAYVALRRPVDFLTPIALLFLIYQAWHLVQSPIGQNQRLHIAVAAAIMVGLAIERSQSLRRRAPAPGARR
jgi:hypothetical protein